MAPVKEGVLLASAQRTATVSTSAQPNRNYRGVIIDINVTAAAATPSVVFTIEARDPIATSTWTSILASAAVTATGHTRLVCYPGAVAVANGVVNQPLPKVWRVTATAGDADALTYSVAYTLVP